MSDELSTSGLRIPVLTDADNKFEIWLIRFRAYACVKGFGSVVSDAGDANMPQQYVDPDTITDKTDKVYKALKKNDLAVAALTNAFEDDVHVNILYKTMTTTWSTGNAGEIIKMLKEKIGVEPK